MMIKKISVLVCALVFTFCMLCSCNSSNNPIITPPPPDDSFVNTYDIMGLNTIGFGVWASPPKEFTTETAYKQIADCGMNFVEGFRYSQTSTDVIKQALELCGQQNLKFLVNDSEVLLAITNYAKDKSNLDKAITAVNGYYDYPAYAGQLLVDEPWATEFATLKIFVDALDAEFPNNAWVINMFPGVDFGYNSSTGTYEGYVDDWLNMGAELYSYDYYPLVSGNTEPSTYFYNLDMLRAKTREKQIPFWSFVQTCSYNNHRVPSRNDMRWNLFANLAFGVKYVQYFTYWTVSGNEAYGDGLIDENGMPTERYGFVKEAHNEVNAYGDLLMRAQSEGVILHGASSTGQHLYSENLTKFDPITAVESEQCVVVGCFSDVETGEKSALIMSDTPRDDVSVTLRLDPSVKKVQAFIGGVKTTVAISGGNLILDIPAGDAIYITF